MADSGAAAAMSDARSVRAIFLLVAAAAFFMSAYQLIVGYPGIGAPMAEIHYPTHLSFALVVLFGSNLVDDLRRRHILKIISDVALIGISITTCGYLVVNADALSQRMTYAEPLTLVQYILAIGLIAAILEAARRTIGWALVAIAVAFLLYAWAGNHLPEPFWHRGRSVQSILEQAYLTADGIWNVPLAVSANYVFLFVLLGALLLSSGAGNFFTDLARGLTGRTVGGAAKTAVVSSTLMGMVTGSTSANVVTTGAFTIPAMKKAGHKAEFAAGVEAVASTGGQLTPPIMGAVAFLMVEFTGTPYIEVIRIAAIPAVLYFIAVYLMIDLDSRRNRLRPALDEALPSVLGTIRRQGYLVIPVIVLLWYLVQGYTPTASGFWAVVSLAALTFALDPANRSTKIFRVVGEAMVEAPKLIASITVACAIGGILAGIIMMTGLGIRISNIILDVSGEMVLLALFLTMIVAVILGMGLPTSAAYIILAALLAPGLVKLGVSVVAAHLFIIYCAAKSSITPPVAIASYAAAAVAGSDPWRTSLIAFRLGLPVFIIPYMFVFGEELLTYGNPLSVIWSIATATLGIMALSVAIIGWLWVPLKPHERLISLAGSLPMIYVEPLTDAIGISLCSICVFMVRTRSRRLRVGSQSQRSWDPKK
jgi:TRAP transporter 4TM/12TM fusion protein